MNAGGNACALNSSGVDLYLGALGLMAEHLEIGCPLIIDRA